MKNSNIAVVTAVSSLLALGTLTSAPAMAAEKEKCYGVAKAGHNDCATKTSSCAGSSTMDDQKDAFIVVPGGLCEKLTGGTKGMG